VAPEGEKSWKKFEEEVDSQCSLPRSCAAVLRFGFCSSAARFYCEGAPPSIIVLVLFTLMHPPSRLILESRPRPFQGRRLRRRRRSRSAAVLLVGGALLLRGSAAVVLVLLIVRRRRLHVRVVPQLLGGRPTGGPLEGDGRPL
jgi:hypothetical protein